MQQQSNQPMMATEEIPSVASSFSYESPLNAYDEAFTEARLPREHWQNVMNRVKGLGTNGMQERQRRAQRILREDGATYNLSSDPLTPSVWSLDLIPNIIDSQQWQSLEQGLVQRSTLFGFYC